jgi:hypothetical protein
MKKRAIKVERCKRSASSSIVGCALTCAEPHVERNRSDIYTEDRRQTMNEPTTVCVGLDAHADSTAIGVAEPGRAAPRFVGTVGPRFAELTRALAKLGKPPSTLMIVYEAGPCGYALARELTGAGYRCEVVAPSKVPRRRGSG